MKKVLLSLLAVAALVLSCQNYDDEFAALNSKVASLESQISSLAGLQTALTQVQSSVSALQAAVSAIPNLSSEVAAILADLSDLETAVSGATTAADLDALKAELNTTLAALQALIEANSASIASVVAANASLKSQLEALGVDVDALLAQNSTYTGNVTITNAAEMNFAQSLGDKVKVINGNVKIQITANNGVTAAGVSAVTKLIQTVVGNVTVETNASIDMSALTAVSGDYVVDGKDISDDALVSAGDILLDYDGGYTMSALTSAKNIFLVDYATTTGASAQAGTLSVVFNTGLKATSISTAASGSVHSSGGGVHSSGGSINVGSYTSNSVTFAEATKVVIGDVPVTNVALTDATELEHHFDGTATSGLSSLTVSGTKLTSVVSKAIKTGALSVTMKTTGSTLSMASLSSAGTVSTNAVSVDLSALKTATSIVASGATSLSLPEFIGVSATVGAPVTAAAATSLTATKLVATTVDIKTGTATAPTSVSVKTVGTLSDVANLGSLTLGAQATDLDLSSAALLTSADITGKDNTVDITIGGGAAALATLSLKGKLGVATIGTSGTDGLAKLVTGLTTAGTIKTLIVQNAKALTGMTLGHTEDAEYGANLWVMNNDKLEKFTTNIDRVLSFKVVGNAILDSFDASSIKTLPSNSSTSTVYEFTVTGNLTTPTTGTGVIGNYKGLVGTKVVVAASATTTASTTHKQDSFNSLKPYLRLLDAAKSATTPTAAEANMTIALEYTHDATPAGSTTAAVATTTITDIDDTVDISAE